MSGGTDRIKATSVRLFTAVVLIAAVVYFVIPLYWLVVASTKTNGELASTFGMSFGSIGAFVDNVHRVFTASDGLFTIWLRNTIVYSTVSAVGAALIATSAGYAFAKYRFRGRTVLLASILVSVAVPATILIVPLFLLLSQMGLVNTPWAFILPSMVNPFGVYLMWIFTEETLPNELIEAARVDGAREFRIFRTIALPLLVPGFVTVLLFSFVSTWNNYFLPLLVFSRQDLFPLTVGLAQWNFQAASSTGGGAVYATFSMVITGSLIAVLPLAAGFLLLQRYWQQGLTMGSVKG